MTNLLELQGVSRTFSHVKALKDVNISISSHQSTGIVGESGAGKSTILNILLGLDQPSQGRVLWEDKPLNPRDRTLMREYRHRVQAVFQDPRSSLDPRMRVGNIIAEPLRSLKIPGDRNLRVREVLESVGLEADAANRFPSQFSGGQRQRIAIARALAPKPQVLIADEPVSALDVSVKAQLMDLFHQLKKTLGLTLIMVSHDIAIVSQLCEQTIVLKDGEVVEAGATTSVLHSPKEPYTRQLLAAIPQLHV